MIDRNRKIFIVGDIDHTAYLNFTKRLNKMEQYGRSIHITLMSDGGDPNVALAFHDRIKMSTCDISITGIGLVASAAALILVAPSTRSMTKNSWLMVHDDIIDAVDGSRMSQIRKIMKDYGHTEEQWNRLMAEATGETIETWAKLHRNETYLSAEKCLELGVIQEII